MFWPLNQFEELKVNCEPQLIAVSKQFPKETIQILVNNGHNIFGENKVQEAQLKWIEFQQEVYLKRLEGKEIKDSKIWVLVNRFDKFFKFGPTRFWLFPPTAWHLVHWAEILL